MTKLVSRANQAAYMDPRIEIKYYMASTPSKIQIKTHISLKRLMNLSCGLYPKEAGVLIKVLAAPAH